MAPFFQSPLPIWNFLWVILGHFLWIHSGSCITAGRIQSLHYLEQHFSKVFCRQPACCTVHSRRIANVDPLQQSQQKVLWSCKDFQAKAWVRCGDHLVGCELKYYSVHKLFFATVDLLTFQVLQDYTLCDRDLKNRVQLFSPKMGRKEDVSMKQNQCTNLILTGLLVPLQ